MGCGQSRDAVIQQQTQQDNKARYASPKQDEVLSSNTHASLAASKVSVADNENITLQSEDKSLDGEKLKSQETLNTYKTEDDNKPLGGIKSQEVLPRSDEKENSRSDHNTVVEENEQIDDAPCPDDVSDQTSEVQEIPELSLDEFVPFREFPTPELLHQANRDYTQLDRPIPKDLDADGQTSRLLPYPTASSKAEVFKPDQFSEIDTHAIEAPAELLNGPVSTLVEYLCNSGPVKSDLERLRVLFRWITAQNLIPIDVDSDVKEGTPHEFLVKLKQEYADYAGILVDLCRAAGLQADKVDGLVKGVDYAVGEPVCTGSTGSWVAVVVDGVWRLCDPHWAARHVSGGGPGDWELIDDNGQGVKPNQKADKEDAYMYYQLNESYFLTDPEEMVYSHLPLESEQYQMLARPVTKNEFDEMANLKPAFFDLGLVLGVHRKCRLHAPEGEVEIDLDLPQKRRRFMYRLWRSTKDDADKQNLDDSKQLDRFVFMQQLGHSLLTKLFFPSAGKFKFELFARDAENEESGPTQTYQMVCTYIIDSDMAKEEIQPLPENRRKEWGPGQDLEHAGLHPVSHHDAIVEADDGTVQVRLKADQDVDLLHKLHSNTMTEEELKNFVVHYKDGDDIVLNVKLPEAGEYALNIFAKDAGTEGTLPNVCSYLLTSDQAAYDPSSFPSVTDGNVGKTDSGRQLDVNCTSHKTAFIEAPESGELDIDLQLSGPCTLKGSLTMQDDENQEEMDKYMLLTQDKNNQARFKVHFPEAGMYLLKVFGKSANTEGASLPNIYNFLIKVPTPKENCMPFPKAFTAFSSYNCTIQEPLGGTLPSNSVVPVSIDVPGASQVAVIGSEGWTHLQLAEDGCWKGEAQTGQPNTQLKLASQTEAGSGSFETLLVYEVVDPETMDASKERQEEVKIKALKKQTEEKSMKQKRHDDVKETHQALVKAMQERDRKKLKHLLKYIEKKRYVSHMRADVSEAKNLLRSLDRIETLKHAVLNMDNATIAEIRRYAKPPKLVHEVMLASLLLLGDHEGKTRNWQQCQTLCNTLGPQGLLRRVKDFDVRGLHSEIAARAHLLISQYRLDDVRNISAGAGTFYAWALGMTEELRLLHPEAKNVQPAGLKRQKDIFNTNKSKIPKKK